MINAVLVVVWLLAGAGVELLNTATRHWSVAQLGLQGERSMSEDGWSVAKFIAGFVVRLGMTSLVLVLAFRGGFASGLSALAGYWICRWIVVWWIAHRLSRKTGS